MGEALWLLPLPFNAVEINVERRSAFRHFAPKKRDHDEKRRAGGMECSDTGTRVNELIHLVFKRHKKLEVL